MAFDVNNIIAWETHEKWTSLLMQSLTREVPSSYAAISVNQLLRADSEFFIADVQGNLCRESRLGRTLAGGRSYERFVYLFTHVLVIYFASCYTLAQAFVVLHVASFNCKQTAHA